MVPRCTKRMATEHVFICIFANHVTQTVDVSRIPARDFGEG